MRRATVLLLVVGMMTLLAATADARGRGAGCGPAACGMGPCMGMGPMGADSAGLSAEVRAMIHNAQAAFQEETLDLRTQLFNKTERFQLLMGDSKAKDEDILKLAQELHGLRGQLATKHLQHILKIRHELPEGTLPGFLMGACGGMGHGEGLGSCCGMGHGEGLGPCCGMGGKGPGPMHGHMKGGGMTRSHEGHGGSGCCGGHGPSM